MEKKDLSFIPKQATSRPIYEKETSISLIFSVTLLIISGLTFGGSYIYKKVLKNNVDELKNTIEKSEIIPEQSLIDELKNTSEKIENAKTLIAKHKTFGPLFDILEESTLKSVRFLNFEYSITDNKPQISMDGVAGSYSSLALQVDSFEENAGVKEVIVSNISIAEGGKINFSIKIIINPSVLIYKNQ